MSANKSNQVGSSNGSSVNGSLEPTNRLESLTPVTFQLNEFVNVLMGLAGSFKPTIKASVQFDSMVKFAQTVGANHSFLAQRENILRLMGTMIANSKHTRTGSKASVLVNFTAAIKELRDVSNEDKRTMANDLKFVGSLLALFNAVNAKEEITLKD